MATKKVVKKVAKGRGTAARNRTKSARLKSSAQAKRIPLVPQEEVRKITLTQEEFAELVKKEVYQAIHNESGWNVNSVDRRLPPRPESARPKNEEASQTNNVLRKAEEIIYGDREQTYGKPDFNLESIGQLWTVYLRRRMEGQGYVENLTIADVCQMMILLKTARLINNPAHTDSIVDQCGYAALHDRCYRPF